MYRAAIATLAALICCASTPPGDGYSPTSLFDLGSRAAVGIPAVFTKAGIVVRVGIAGRNLDFILDSGSAYSLLDSQVARGLGMPSLGRATASFGGDYTVENSRAPDITVGDLRATNVAISTAALHRQPAGRRVDGLLGADFLWSGALEVDFETHRLILHGAVPSGLHVAGWSSIPLRFEWGVPLIEAAFNGRDGQFLVDLGSTKRCSIRSTSPRFMSSRRLAATTEIRCSRLPASPFRSNTSS